MKIKTYLVSSLAEAIERIKRDLGPEAVILSTKKTMLSDKWWNRDSGLEVTAAIDLPSKPSENAAPVSTTGQTMRIVSQLTEKMAERQISPIKEEITRLRESLEQMVQAQRQNATSHTAPAESPVESLAEIKIQPSPGKPQTFEEFEKPSSFVAPQRASQPEDPEVFHPRAQAFGPLEETKPRAPTVFESAEEMDDMEGMNDVESVDDISLDESLAWQVSQASLATISTPSLPSFKISNFSQTASEAPRKSTEVRVSMSRHSGHPPSSPEGIQIARQVECISQEWLAEMHRQRKSIYEISLDLLSHRLRPQTVQDLTHYLLETNPDGTPTQLREQAAEWLMDHLPDCRPFTPDPNRQNLVAMIGPTGSGKTTTLVKLASHLVLEKKQSIAFISLDYQRIGGKEQLKRHAAILKAPCLYARTPLQFQKAAKSLENFSVVLIDTAGCSPNDDRAVWDLHQTLSCDKPVWKGLVIPAVLQEPDMSRTIRKFSTVRCQNLIVTKLDETSCFGTLYNAPTQSSLTPAYFTMGQQIPEDFEIASKERIIDCLLNFSEFAADSSFDADYDAAPQPSRDLQ